MTGLSTTVRRAGSTIGLLRAPRALTGDGVNLIRRRTGRPRRLLSAPATSRTTWSARRINAVRRRVPGMTRYLEIGVQYGRTLEQVEFPLRVAVDPEPRFDRTHLPAGVHVHPCTSDAYFAEFARPDSFDLVFVDGLHEFRQTYRDVLNALRVCPDGPILIDDVVPHDATSALADQEVSLAERRRLGLPGRFWHGNVYLVVVALHRFHPELHLRTLGQDNPQTLLWRAEGHSVGPPASPEALDELATTTYEDWFAPGAPHFFNVVDDQRGIDDAVHALRHRFRY